MKIILAILFLAIFVFIGYLSEQNEFMSTCQEERTQTECEDIWRSRL